MVQKKKKKKILLSKDKYQTILKYLQATYPKCFTTLPVPLAIGIHNILMTQESGQFGKTDIRKFLKIYTALPDYKKKLLS